jgi:hypothetical protein
MQLIKQYGPYCLVTSAAMCLGVDPEAIHKFIGHDGTSIAFPPSGMKGVHIQEIIDYAMVIGKTFFPIDLHPAISPDEHTEPKPIYRHVVAKDRFPRVIRGRVGILITPGHAVAWDGGVVLDPKGFRKSISEYTVHEAWLMADLIPRRD